MIQVEAFENEKGKAFAVCYWKEKGVIERWQIIH